MINLLFCQLANGVKLRQIGRNQVHGIEVLSSPDRSLEPSAACETEFTPDQLDHRPLATRDQAVHFS